MSELQSIESALQKTAMRRRWQQAWRDFWQGFFAGALVWLLMLAAYKLVPIPSELLLIAAAVAVVLMLAGFVVGWWRRPSLSQTARWVDEKQNLQERLSTALEVSASKIDESWKQLIVGDAVKHVPQVNPKRLLPYGLPRAASWSLLILALAAGLGFVPELRTQKFVQKQRDTQVIKEAGRQLAELTRRSLENRPPALEPTRQSLDAVAELGDHLNKAQLTRAEALKDLSSVTEKLKEQVRELGRNPAFQSMEKAARSSTERGGTENTAELQKKLDELQKALGNQPKDPDALEKLKHDLQQAAQTAANLPDKDAPGAAEATEKFAQNLSELARQAMEMGLSLPALEEAIAALAASQTDQLVRDLKAAVVELDKLKMMAKALQDLQAKADKTGKDLPEQLEFGQAEAARSRLAEMIEQLKSATGLESEQLKKLTDEVERSVHPASQYGKAAQSLKEAAQQMQKGDKAAAIESLQAAAKELQDLMQQMGDAQSMLASLDALQQAQMAIANGQAWSQGKGQPRAGRGNGVGRGVGTWGDDSRMMDISDIKDRWDNSGFVRQDEESRGLSDRGDPQLADNLAPTKIKGQINPGGPMPSITLKGVSIKGMSKVQIEEAAAGAQSDAQSALSQEQVPRAYRGAVKDYFDDLKK